MKRHKREKSFSKDYFPVVLFQEDIEELVEILNSAGVKAIHITNEEYVFNTIADAAAHFGSKAQNKFEIASTSPYITIEFAPMWSKVYVSHSEHSAQIFFEINALMERKQRKFPFLYSFWIAPISWIPLALQFYGVKIELLLSKNALYLYNLFYLSLLAWLFWMSFVRLRFSSTLYFQRRSERKSFFDRNKDQLLMHLITGVGSFVMGSLVGSKLKDYLFP